MRAYQQAQVRVLLQGKVIRNALCLGQPREHLHRKAKQYNGRKGNCFDGDMRSR